MQIFWLVVPNQELEREMDQARQGRMVGEIYRWDTQRGDDVYSMGQTNHRLLDVHRVTNSDKSEEASKRVGLGIDDVWSLKLTRFHTLGAGPTAGG